MHKIRSSQTFSRCISTLRDDQLWLKGISIECSNHKEHNSSKLCGGKCLQRQIMYYCCCAQHTACAEQVTQYCALARISSVWICSNSSSIAPLKLYSQFIRTNAPPPFSCSLHVLPCILLHKHAKHSIGTLHAKGAELNWFQVGPGRPIDDIAVVVKVRSMAWAVERALVRVPLHEHRPMSARTLAYHSACTSSLLCFHYSFGFYQLHRA